MGDGGGNAWVMGVGVHEGAGIDVYVGRGARALVRRGHAGERCLQGDRLAGGGCLSNINHTWRWESLK